MKKYNYYQQFDFKQFILPLSMFALLQGCNWQDSNDNQSSPRLSNADLEEMRKGQIVLRKKFDEMVPNEWVLKEFTEWKFYTRGSRVETADYWIYLPLPKTEYASRVVTGAVILNGGIDYRATPYTLAMTNSKDDPKEQAAVNAQYPDIKGYVKQVSARAIGTNLSTKEEQRHIGYWNESKKIYCGGVTIGNMQCIMGKKGRYFVVSFDSVHAERVLPYIYNLSGKI
jgi:hypothetical protein